MYARRIVGKDLTFGVSGLLYASNVLMYDHQTESLWLQVGRKAVTGPLSGTRLAVLPSTVTTWDKWRKRFPDTLILSKETGYSRDYSRDPYESYYQSRRGLFARLFGSKAESQDKELVAGVEIGGLSRAYPLSLLRRTGRIADSLGGQAVTLTWNDATDSVTVIAEGGASIEHLVSYWFVWRDIHPDTELYKNGEGP